MILSLGLEKTFGNVSFTANAYYMNYVNQLVLSGEINMVGELLKLILENLID